MAEPEASLLLRAAILDHVRDAVVAIDHHGRVVFWNAAAAATYGIPASDILGRPLAQAYQYEFMTAGDAQASAAALERDGFWRGDVLHLLRSGARQQVEASVSRFHDGAGIGYVAVLRDVTARRELERRLEAARERLGIALGAAHAAAWEWQPATRTVDWSPEFYDLFGFDRSVVPSYEVWLSAIHPEDRDRLPAEFAAAIAARRRDYRIEHRIVRDDEVRWIANVGRITYGADEQSIGAIGISIDITTQKTHELERERLLASEREAHAAAQAAVRARDLFIATISHELRNPVNAVLGWVRILSGLITEGDDRVARALTAIERGARAEAVLIDELIDLSRVPSGKLRIEKRPIDLSDLVRRATDQIRPVAAAHRLTVVDEVESGIVVDADESRIQQVAGNLLSNAVKFTPPGGRIDVRLRSERGEAVLTVVDTGEGIPPELMPTIFEPFTQAVESARRHAGLGLGLPIARRLVELHEGTIAAESAGVGHGATFTVRLPIHGAPAS